MSALNCRTLPKPLIVKSYAGLTLADNTLTDLLNIVVPAQTAYQFTQVANTFVLANTGGESVLRVQIRTYFESATVIPESNLLAFLAVNPNDIANPDTSNVQFSGLIYNTSSEDVTVFFKIIVDVSGGTSTLNGSNRNVLFWEVPVAGFRVL